MCLADSCGPAKSHDPATGLLLLGAAACAYPEAVDNLHIKLLASDLSVFDGLQYQKASEMSFNNAKEKCGARLLDARVYLPASKSTNAECSAEGCGAYVQSSITCQEVQMRTQFSAPTLSHAWCGLWVPSVANQAGAGLLCGTIAALSWSGHAMRNGK